MAMKFNKDIIKAIQEDTAEKAKRALSDEERMNDLYQGKGYDAAIDKFLENKGVFERIDITLLDDYPENHFHRIDGARWDELVGSIKAYGIVQPLHIRPKGDRYEILAGHNRKYAAIENGLTTVPCIVMDVDDVEASIIVAISNTQREDTTDLEWGWAYRNTLELLKAGAHDEHQRESAEQEYGAHDEHQNEKGVKTIEIVAKKYGISRATAQRKIRLTYLIVELYNALIDMDASQNMMVNLSYLTKVDQANLGFEIAHGGLVITEEVAEELKKMALAKNGENIGIDTLLNFARSHGEVKVSVPRPKKYAVEETLFPSGLKKGDRQGYIEKALAYILENGINLIEEKGGEE